MKQNLTEGVLSQDHQSIARLISLVENGNYTDIESILSEIYNKTGNSYRLGITGPPGAGKSSITNELINRLSENKSIAILSVDPTSPFTGGAILGDRIRMIDHYNNPNVFIRSIGSRGSKGGLAENINIIGDILDAAGFDIIIFETVGVGQVELDIIETADTTVVVLVPESGDDIQILKAGMMEIADIFVINKSDRDGADKIAVSLNNFLSTVHTDDSIWSPKVVKTSVYAKTGFGELIDTIFSRYEFMNQNGYIDKKHESRYTKQVKNLVSNHLENSFWDKLKEEALNKQLRAEIKNRANPVMLAKKLIDE